MTTIFIPIAAGRATRAKRHRDHPAMRVKQLLAASLSVALALPPDGFAQRAGAAPLEAAPAIESPSISTVPPGIAADVFGTYGGAEVRARMAKAFGRDTPAAFIEDAGAIILGLIVVGALR